MDAYVLCLETSTACCSVALAKPGACLASVTCQLPRGHAHLLPTLCEQVLTYAQVPKEELSAIALSEGPGSFTGLRIGAATAKALCYGLSIPLIACPTLQTLAAAAAANLPKNSLLLPLLPQKGSTYAYALYDAAHQVLLPPQMGALQLPPWTSFATQANIYAIGPAPEALGQLHNIWPKAQLHPFSLTPSAIHMAPHASHALTQSHFAPLNTFEPCYLGQKWQEPAPSNLPSS